MGSPYASPGASTGSVYAESGTTTSSPYAAAPGAAPAKKGRGFLGGLGHFIAQKSELAGHDLKGIPGGLIDLGVAGALDVRDEYEHPLRINQPDRLLHLAGAAGKGSLESLEHPLRDPFLTLVSAIPALRVVGGLGVRAGVAASAAGEEGATAASVLRAAAKPPDLGPRILRVGGHPEAPIEVDSSGVADRVGGPTLRVPLYTSKNPAVRLVQAGYDKVIQHALDTNPEGRVASHATKRAAGSLAETDRIRTRMIETPAAMVERAGVKLGPGRLSARRLGGQVPRKVQEAALRLVSENNTGEEAQTFHLGQARQGVAVKANLKQAKLSAAVARAGLIVRDAKGNAVINAADHPRLAAADALVARGQAQVDKIAEDFHLMTPEGLESRRNGPARIRAGAKYVEPTPGKLGKPSEKLLAQRAHVARLEVLHGRAVASTRAAGEKAVTASEKTKPASLADVQALHPKVEISATEKPAGITLSMIRTAEGDRGTGLASAAMRALTAYADRVDKPIALTPDRVGSSGLSKTKLEAWYRSLGFKRNAGANKDFAFRESHIRPPQGGDTEALIGSRLTGPGHVVTPAGGARADKLGAALSVQRDRLAQMERAAKSREEPTGIVGAEGLPRAERRVAQIEEALTKSVAGSKRHQSLTEALGVARSEAARLRGVGEARPGRGFVSYKTVEAKAPKGQVSGASSPVVGKAKSFITKRPFTGHGLEAGQVPDNTSRLVARHMRDAYRYVNTDRFRRNVLQTGAKTRRTSRDVLVREPDAETVGKIPAELDDLLGRKSMTVGELDAAREGFDAWHQLIVPGVAKGFSVDKAAGIGARAPEGYRWVDRNLLGDLGKPSPGPRNVFARAADKLNTAVTAATVYWKVGHLATRFVTNAVTNIIQGSAKPADIGRSFKLWDALTDEERLKALAASGQHSFNALPLSDETGPLSKGISAAGRVGANWWAKHADAPFRFNAIAYEARKAGFDTPAKFRYLLAKLEDPTGLDAAQTAKVEWVAKRANREGIAYDRLSDFERRYVTRPFWFWPWTAGAARFAINTLTEHPLKSVVLGSAGVEGRQAQQRELGDLPSYEEGLFKLGGAIAKPNVADFSTFSPFATPGDVLDVPAGREPITGFLNPVYGSALALALGQNQYGQHSNHPIGDALSSLFAPTPEAQILSAYEGEHQDQSKRMFHKTPLNQLARAFVGPGLPRTVNTAALRSAAARQRSGR